MFDTPEAKAALQAAIEEATAGLATKNKELLAELKEARKGRQVDPAELDKLEAKIESLTADLNAANKVAKDAQKQAETAQKQLQSESGFTQKLLVDNGLNDALTKAGVAPQFLPMVKAMLGSQASVAVDGDARRVMMGDKELSAYIAEWAKGDDAKHVLAAPANGGGGASGGANGSAGVKNPWAKGSFNLTEQGRIVQENPQLAASLQASAGAA